MALNNETQYDEELEDVMVKSVDIPQCYNCIYSDGVMCKKFNKNKNDVPVDIFDCQYYKSEENEALKMLGVDSYANKNR